MYLGDVILMGSENKFKAWYWKQTARKNQIISWKLCYLGSNAGSNSREPSCNRKQESPSGDGGWFNPGILFSK